MINETVKELFDKYKNLSKEEKCDFAKMVKPYWPDFNFDDYEKPITKKENIIELQEKLVQLCIDYINEHNLKDIDIVDFSADSLQESSKVSGWSPMTDSFIEIYGYQEDTNKSVVRKKIGSYC